MQKNSRLQIWLEQGNTTIPQLFFSHYKDMQIADSEALILMHLMAFHQENNDFPTPEDFTKRLSFSENDITLKLRKLMQKGFIEITQGIDNEGKISEKYSLIPLWEQLLDYIEKSQIENQEKADLLQEADLFSLFEQEFGRLLSPIEIETISMWLDNDGHSPEIIKAALKEAVLAGKLSFRYVDRILFEWKKRNIKSLQQVQQHTDEFREKTMKPVVQNNPAAEEPKKVTFYNWLDEREGK